MAASTPMTPEEELFQMVMKGNWVKVVEIYTQNPRTHTVQITRSGDTALHMAVSGGKEEIVKKLIDQIKSPQGGGIEALKIGNEHGNTPLHLAVSMGTVAMCTWIAQVDSSLVGARNKASETPFFLAAFHGRKEIFLLLLPICGYDNGLRYSRRGNGETILHVAIAADYFDLAFQIIHLYGDTLVNSFDAEGFSPLHRLASNPSNFRSGSYFGLYDKIIYNCLLVDELQVDPKVLKELNDHQQMHMREELQVIDHPLMELINQLSDAGSNNESSSRFQSCWKYVARHVMGKKGDQTAESDLERDPGSEVTNIGAPGNQPFPPNYVTCFEFLKLSLKAVLVVLGQGSEVIKLGAPRNQPFPPNYVTCFEFLKLPLKPVLVILRSGYTQLRQIHDKKQKHIWSVQIMNELLERASMSEYINTGMAPQPSATSLAEDDSINEILSKNQQKSKSPIPKSSKAKQIDKSEGKDTSGEEKKNRKTPSPILIAAKNGITEIVEKILKHFPMAVHDMNVENKNIVLLAVENRQEHVYQLLKLNKDIPLHSVFRVVDNEGNSALHLAAKLGDYKPRLIPGAALQMQWEIKWYEFVKDSMPHDFFPGYNMKRKTPEDLFTESHSNLIKEGSQWLNKTSDSCSVIAALIATVAFATSATVPGGVNEESGTPRLENQPAFNVFATSSLIALCFSITAVITFHIFILTTPDQESDFGRSLPTKLLVGLTSLFVSIASMLISFCAGHFIMVKDKLKHAAIAVYVVACLPVMCYAMVQFPLYVHLLWAIFKKVPQRSYKAVHHAL